jgi:hypothetical protein
MTGSQTAIYKTALKEARTAFDKARIRLTDIKTEEYFLTDELNRLRRTITALAALCTEAPGLDDMGITESCVEIMETQKGLVTTTDVVASLELRGFDISSQKNAAASVHAVLDRLARKGKIERIDDEQEQVIRWKGPNYDPDYGEVPF